MTDAKRKHTKKPTNPGLRGVAADMMQVHRPTAPIAAPKPVGLWGWVRAMLDKWK